MAEKYLTIDRFSGMKDDSSRNDVFCLYGFSHYTAKGQGLCPDVGGAFSDTTGGLLKWLVYYGLKAYGLGGDGKIYIDDGGHGWSEEHDPTASNDGDGEGMCVAFGELVWAGDTKIGKYNGSTWTDDISVSLGDETWHPMIFHQDKVWIGDGKDLASLDSGLDSGGFTGSDLALQEGWVIRGLASAGDSLAIGANRKNTGGVFFWDMSGGTAANYLVPIPDSVQAMKNVGGVIFVAGERGLWKINGRTAQLVTEYPDKGNRTIYPDAIEFWQNKLFLGLNGSMTYLKRFSAIWTWDLKWHSWVPLPLENPDSLSCSIGSVTQFEEYDNSLRFTYFGKNSSNSDVNSIGYTSNFPGIGGAKGNSNYERYFILKPNFGNDTFRKKILKGIKINLQEGLSNFYDTSSFVWNVQVRIFRNKEPFGIEFASDTNSTNDDEIINTFGSDPVPGVGDEITLVGDGYKVGEIRKVTTVEEDTPSAGKTTLTVDSDFSNTPESGADYNFTPWEEVLDWSLSSTTTLKDAIWIPIADKKFDAGLLIKVVFNVPSGSTSRQPTFGPITIVYEPKRIKQEEV